MNVVSRYDADIGVLFCGVSGPADPQDLLASFNRVFDDPGIPDNTDAIWDLRHLDFSTASPEMIKRMAEVRISVHEKRAGSRYAFVVSSDSQEALVRLFWAHSEKIDQVKAVFRSMEEAMDWLVGPREKDAQPPASSGA